MTKEQQPFRGVGRLRLSRTGIAEPHLGKPQRSTPFLYLYKIWRCSLLKGSKLQKFKTMEAVVMAWNKIGYLAAFSLVLIFAACGGDTGSNVSNENGNSGESIQNEPINSSASNSWSESAVSSASLEISDVKYVFEYFDNFIKGSARGEKGTFIAEKVLYCQTMVGQNNNLKMQEYQLKVYHNQQNNQQEILQEPELDVYDSVGCLCGGASWSVYLSSADAFFYCDRDVSGIWIWKPIQSGDGVAIRKDGLAYKTYVDDRDGNVYAIGLVGGRIWMLQDLRLNTGNDDYCYYSYNRNNVTANGDATDAIDQCELGRRYSEKSALGIDGIYLNNGLPLQGACPQGWHIPDTSEWVSSSDQRIHNYYNSELSANLNYKTNWNEYEIRSAWSYWSSTYDEKQNSFYTASWGRVWSLGDIEIHDYGEYLPADTIKHVVGVRCVKNDRVW